MGDKKENYFLLMRHEIPEKRIEKTLNTPIKNLPIANPNFLKNFKKAVTQLSQKNRIIEEFQSDQDNDKKMDDKLVLELKPGKREEPQTNSKLFGILKFPI